MWQELEAFVYIDACGHYFEGNACPYCTMQTNCHKPPSTSGFFFTWSQISCHKHGFTRLRTFINSISSLHQPIDFYRPHDLITTATTVTFTTLNFFFWLSLSYAFIRLTFLVIAKSRTLILEDNSATGAGFKLGFKKPGITALSRIFQEIPKLLNK